MALRLDPKIFNASLYKTIRSVWFADVPANATAAPQQANRRWFGLDGPEARASFDQVCHENFREALNSIGPEQYPVPAAKSYDEEHALGPVIAGPFLEQIESAKDSEKPASTALSLLLLLDQMPRNIFRDDQKLIYTHYDRLSRAIAYAMLDKPEAGRWDLSPEYRNRFAFRSWFYLPLMHSEHLRDHEQIAHCLDSAEEDAAGNRDNEAVEDVRRNRGFEIRHADIIKKFGRYPHRNDVMERNWTKEEREWIESGGDTFGTS